MEAYALAKVCKIYGYDFTAFKFISDDGNPDDWEENHHLGVEKFLKKLAKYLENS
jgi:nucleoside phosphorylase